MNDVLDDISLISPGDTGLPHGLSDGVMPDQATALYISLDEARLPLSEPEQAQTWAAVQRFVDQRLSRGGGAWWHQSSKGWCAVFAERQSALQCAWRLPDLTSLRPRQRWRLSLDVMTAEAQHGPGAEIARLHALAQLGLNGLPVMGHRLRDAVLEPLDGEVQDLGLCHLKHVQGTVRAYQLHPPAVPQPVAHPGGLPRLVLLPPQPVHDSPAHRAFGPLLVDRVSHQLGRSQHVSLVHPLSSRLLASRAQAEADAQRCLGADYVLSGQYRVVGEHGLGTLALDLSLYAQHDGQQVWAQSFRAEVGDVLAADSALVNDVSTGVHHAVLHAHMDWASQQALRTLDDYALLLTGVGLMHRSAPDDFDISRRALLTLLERSPQMGQAHAWLAKWHVLRVTRALTQHPQQEADVAESHAAQAVQASDAAGLARAMQGFVRLHLRRDLHGALQDLQSCTAEHPNEPLAWLFRGVAEAFADKGDAALQASQRALTLSPLDPLLYYFESLSASSALVAGDAAQARRWCEQSLRRNVMHLHTHRALITALCMGGEASAARRAARQLLALSPGYTVAQFARTGSSAETRLGQLMREALAQAGIPPGDLA